LSLFNQSSKCIFFIVSWNELRIDLFEL
jgi:hypothetical protein